ncbi:MAG: type 4a pilus biogenesis protein PilO [Planctomycetota bacterium]
MSKRSWSQILPFAVCLVSLASAGVTLLQLNDKEARVRRAGREQSFVRNRVERLERRLAETKQSARAMYLAVPDAPEVTDVLVALERSETRSGVRLATIEVPPSPEAGRQGYKLRGTGTANALARFLSCLEELPRILVIRTLAIRARSEPGTEFEIELEAFHSLEER